MGTLEKFLQENPDAHLIDFSNPEVNSLLIFMIREIEDILKFHSVQKYPDGTEKTKTDFILLKELIDIFILIANGRNNMPKEKKELSVVFEKEIGETLLGLIKYGTMSRTINSCPESVKEIFIIIIEKLSVFEDVFKTRNEKEMLKNLELKEGTFLQNLPDILQ